MSGAASPAFWKNWAIRWFARPTAWRALREFHSRKFNLVITDIRMPEIDGLELLRRIKTIEQSPWTSSS